MMRKWWTRARPGSDRGLVEAGVAAGGALLVVGALVGNGLTATVVDMSDGQTWLPGHDGRIVQVNPTTGTPERKLIVGDDGSMLSISQHDGDLIVVDETTGTITAVDLTALVASGSRTSGGEQRVLIGGGLVVLVDADLGIVRAVDPLTLADRGEPFRADARLADVAVDGDGAVWVLTDAGDLTQLGYSAGAAAFQSQRAQAIPGAGSRSRLVPHDRGVTVFAADGGAVVQTGAGADVALTVPDLAGTVHAAGRSPATLVPASATDEGLLFMLTDRDLLQVDVGGLGCARPGGPEVFDGRVYVPCLGMGRVLVLNPDGTRAGADIIVPGGGDPQFITDEGRLFLTTTDDGRAVIVQPGGSSGVVDLGQSRVPERPVTQPPAVTVPTDIAPVVTDRERERDDDRRDQRDRDEDHDRGAATPDPAPDGDNVPTPGVEYPIPGVDVPTPGADDPTPGVDDPTPGVDDPTPGADDPTPGPGDPTPGADDPTPGAGDPTPGAGDPTPGAGDPTPGAGDPTPGAGDPTPNPDPGADPDPETPAPDDADLAPTGVSAVARGSGVEVSWTAPEVAATGYIIGAAGISTSAPAAATSATLSGLDCGTRVTVTVTAAHRDWPSGSSTTTTTTAACAVAQATPATGVTATRSGSTVTVAWTRASSGADEYLVMASGGSWISAGTSTSLTFSSLGHGTYSFVVQTVLGATTAESTASDPVTLADAPGAPGTPAITLDTASAPSGFGFQVSWPAAAANGSAITGYTVTYQGGGRTQSTTTTATSFSGSVSCAQASACTDSVALSVTVTATNAVGTGAAATGSATERIAWPADGDSAISRISFSEPGLYESDIPYSISASLPASWERAASCTLHVNVAGANQTRAIPCDASGAVHSGQVRSRGSVSAYVTATGTRPATSASLSEQAPNRNQWAQCDPTTRICTDPVSFDDPDVTITPAPWTPPTVPSPPMLAAGVFMLGTAGFLRRNRRTAASASATALSTAAPDQNGDAR